MLTPEAATPAPNPLEIVRVFVDTELLTKDATTYQYIMVTNQVTGLRTL